MSVLVGKPAPSFSASAVVDGQVVENFSLDQYKGEKYVILFFYPKISLLSALPNFTLFRIA